MQQPMQALDIVEALRHGPIAIDRIEAIAGGDGAALIDELCDVGWMLRAGDTVELGPRAIALAAYEPHRAYLIRTREICHLLSGLTGLMVTVSVLAGSRQLFVAGATGPDGLPDFMQRMADSLWATASGVALLAQLDPASVERLLDADPPRPLTSVTPDRVRLERILEEFADTGYVYDEGWSEGDARCVSVAFPRLGSVPAAITAVGFAGMHRERLVLAETQLRAAAEPHATRSSIIRSGIVRPGKAAPAPGLLVDAVRAALRDFHAPAALADNLLAPPVGALTMRAVSVRARIESAVGSAFDDSADDAFLRAIVRRGYLDPDAAPARGMRELHVSRTTFFRRAGEAAERIASQILADANDMHVSTAPLLAERSPRI
ncbi:IclR family transcriptional regulator C-terminal domain-containing protein [Microbacterium sp. NPDC016588]